MPQQRPTRRYFGRTVAELSTGTRRMLELACLTSLQPHVLLLDEPSSGIAQRETEALAQLIARMRDEFAMTIVFIEHDIPLVMSLSDRMIAMAEGRIMRTGTPAEVRADEAVVESYLGTREEAINRSNLTTI